MSYNRCYHSSPWKDARSSPGPDLGLPRARTNWHVCEEQSSCLELVGLQRLGRSTGRSVVFCSQGHNNVNTSLSDSDGVMQLITWC